MKTSLFRIIIVGIIASVLLVGACSTGFIAGGVLIPNTDLALSYLPKLQGSPSTESGEGGSPQDMDELFAPFWQTWQIIHDRYVNQPVDDDTLMRGAIKGILESLGDKHTSYLDPDQYESFTIQHEGEYEGIGAWVDISGDFLAIISPMPGSPAEVAGLKPQDKIIAVDGEDMTGIDGELVRRRIIGPEGSTVVLTVLRSGVSEPFDVEVERANITIPSVEVEMLDGNVAYLRLFIFGTNTRRDLRKSLKELLAQKPVGLILDMRDNGGGYRDTAIEVASEFIADGIIMYQDFGDGTRTTFEALSGGLATETPLVVLINEGTASASEIVAGAIQDHGRGLLVGVTTYGKGSVQDISPLDDDQGAVRVTIALWLTPNERQIHEIGLEPDVEVQIAEEDFQDDRDPQLDKAVELLTQ